MATGDLDFTQANVRVLLLTDKHQPDLEHSDRGDVQADEVTGLGYTAGGNDVDCFVERDDEKTDVRLAGSVWGPPATIAAKYACYYHHRDTGHATDDELIALISFGVDESSENGIFTLSESTIRFGSRGTR